MSKVIIKNVKIGPYDNPKMMLKISLSNFSSDFRVSLMSGEIRIKSNYAFLLSDYEKSLSVLRGFLKDKRNYNKIAKEIDEYVQILVNEGVFSPTGMEAVNQKGDVFKKAFNEMMGVTGE